MKCGICKADTQDQLVTYTEDVKQGVVIIRHVPARVCTECGNIWYSGAVAARLEAIVSSVISKVHPEVAVLDYVDCAA
jgi:YgiT-type zinc finger domain-containing protein